MIIRMNQQSFPKITKRKRKKITTINILKSMMNSMTFWMVFFNNRHLY